MFTEVVDAADCGREHERTGPRLEAAPQMCAAAPTYENRSIDLLVLQHPPTSTGKAATGATRIPVRALTKSAGPAWRKPRCCDTSAGPPRIASLLTVLAPPWGASRRVDGR